MVVFGLFGWCWSKGVREKIKYFDPVLVDGVLLVSCWIPECWNELFCFGLWSIGSKRIIYIWLIRFYCGAGWTILVRLVRLY